ncbi:RNA-binding protein [candidate division WWE3 bacterium CG08_land_8_20_14_0_20_40_13]|uniref:RNA-binding protein n=1 Tax=candidate division WWE3 bacterium CG08_land_8_20_14_0_20_40_13 TaxID=1975084 RepID=A0A2H0XET4_UNCKA|nr:MAG: RNA-binding protein [candidate division WWE3 bacterium CG08_land_8_20_14_0_20_40_13]
MSKKLYVGNLPFRFTNEDIKTTFAEVGNVVDAVVITDKMTKRSRGFGFVEFSTEEEAQKALADFNGKDLEGRKLVVDMARERQA